MKKKKSLKKLEKMGIAQLTNDLQNNIGQKNILGGWGPLSDDSRVANFGSGGCQTGTGVC